MFMLTTVLLAGAAVATPVQGDERDVNRCPIIGVRKAGARRSPEKPVFSAREVGDLELVVAYPRRLTGRRMELKLRTPRGHLYQTLAVMLEPFPRQRVLGEASVRLPVSGTLIEQGALFGSWSVVPVLDGAESSCRERRFVLKR
jgi:hypothetical protein